MAVQFLLVLHYTDVGIGGIRNGAPEYSYASCAHVRCISAGCVLGTGSPASDAVRHHSLVRGTRLPGESLGFQSKRECGGQGSLKTQL